MSFDDFWPSELSNSGFDIGAFLKKIAAGLDQKSDGQLAADIEFAAVSNVFRYTMQILPRGWPNYSFELLTVKTPDGGFPVVVSTTHTKPRDFKVNKKESLEEAVRNILKDPATIRILKTLKDEMSSDNPTYSESDFRIKEVSVDEIGANNFSLAETGFDHEGERFAAIDIYSVGGFVSFRELRRLSMSADMAGSPYTYAPDGRVMVDMKFSSSVRFFLTKQEADNLRLASSKLLLKDME